MKTPKLVLSVLACSVVVGNYAQNIPTHAPYVELLPTKEISIAGGDKKTVYLDFYDYFESWEPGVPLSEDENFYIARVPMKKTFREHGNTGRSHHDARPQIQYVDADGYIRHLLAIASAICIRRR